ncbi:MAG: FtsX-like permease family protein, partial [Clostridia bacterium]
ISSSRGTSKLGAGSVNYYMYIPKSNINMDIYTVAYITVDGALELATYSNEYEDLINDIEDKIEEISVQRKQARYDEIVNEATEKLDEAQAEYDEEKQKAESEIADAENQLADAKKQVEDGEAELKSSRKKAQTEFANADKKIEEGQKQIDEAKSTLESKKIEASAQIEEAQTNLELLKTTNEQYKTLINQKSEVESQITKIDVLLEELEKDEVANADKITELIAQKQILNETLTQINTGIAQIQQSLATQGLQAEELDTAIVAITNQISSAQKELEDAENTIKQSEQELLANKKELENQKASTNQKLAQAEQELENARKEIEENEIKLEDAKKEANEKLDEAQEKLNDARVQISKIEKPTWYILDRNSNYGYAEYMQDTDRIAKIAEVFPLIFFLVAALISLTSMSRMIEEQRVQIGTLKALGYNKIEISIKYIIYALLATIIGGLIGIIIGVKIIPEIIISMYEMMYNLPEASCIIRCDIGLAGIGFALICTLGATIYTCIKELKEKPASLMLPRAPKPGKRILLERIKFIWSRINFSKKVTARNIFRYKKKFLMTIIGVAGCTSLIIVGFGIRDAVSQMIPMQYGEIFKYDAIVTLEDDITTNQINEEQQRIKEQEKVQDTLSCYMKTVEITSIKNAQTLNLLVINPEDNFSEFIALKSRSKKQNYNLDDNTVIISEKISTLLNIKVGDKITIKDTNDLEKEVTIGAITENYLNHYIYMSSNLYNELYGENTYKPNSILIKETENTTLEEEDSLGKTILQGSDNISGVSFLSISKDIFSGVMDNMKIVVYVLIVAAGLLAFAVLYNLSNVNISERIKELATLKVLGFYNKEVFDYVTKETRILTAIGAFFGLFGGTFLTKYIMKTCELDMFMFNPKIDVMSFVYGVVITIIFAEIVNFAVNRTLKKINMADSLKSVD